MFKNDRKKFFCALNFEISIQQDSNSSRIMQSQILNEM